MPDRAARLCRGIADDAKASPSPWEQPDDTGDLRVIGGSDTGSDIGLDLLDDASNVEWRFLHEDVSELSPALVAGFDAILVERARVPASALVGNNRLAIVARFGSGYDRVDVDACTASGVLVTNAPDGVRRPMAVAAH